MSIVPHNYHRFYYFCRAIVIAVVRLFSPIRLVGGHHLPASGPVLIASNHVSFLDPPVIGSAVKRRLCYLAKAELFKYRLSNWLLRRVGAFPVKRGESDLEAMRLAIDLLKQGEALVIFPEGQRSRDGLLGQSNAGVGMLAKRAGAAVLPCAVIGTRKMYGPGAKFFSRSRIIVALGEPLVYTQFAEGRPDQEARVAFGDELMRRIEALLLTHGGAVKDNEGIVRYTPQA